DGTLVADLPGNAEPGRVAPMPGARLAVRRARAEGLLVGVVSNQSAVGLGRLRRAEVQAVNRRVDELFGAFDTWQVCMHAPAAGCGCRKPAPGLVTAAANALGVDPRSCAVIGDTAADVGAAAGAGARGVLVPTRVTRPSEIVAAPVVAADLTRAVDLVLAGMC
ncbi:MAG: HAD family hydrolase, partial [Acidimicrobiaceae bacterium]|nr:HAD family hydrolase [Acidimicrobiaceae bacterium]